MQQDSHEETPKLMSNSKHVVESFRGSMCHQSHLLQLIQGSEGGIRLSVWRQCYPAPMVNLLVVGAVRCMGGQRGVSWMRASKAHEGAK